MRYAPGHKEEARERIVKAAGRGFRKGGFGGIGVDGLAKEAGVTSGAFYGHFSSKNEAFRAVVAAGMDNLVESIRALQTAQGDNWADAFIDRYLGERRTCDLGDACVLQALTPEVSRCSDDIRAAYEATFLKVVDTVAKGLQGKNPEDKRRRAIALLTILSGGVTLARAVGDPLISEEIANALKPAARAIASGD